MSEDHLALLKAIVEWGVLIYVYGFYLLFTIIVIVQWRQRRAAGFRLKDGIQRNEWTVFDIIGLLAALTAFYGSMMLLQIFLQRKGILATDNHNALFFLSSQSTFYIFFFALVGVHLRRVKASWTNAFGLRASSAKRCILVATLVLGAILLPVSLVERISHWILNLMGFEVARQPILDFLLGLDNPWLRGGIIAMAIVGAPIFEESLFRGVIYPALKRRLGFFNALWITTLFFAIIHVHIPSIPALFCLAVVFTLIYEWTGNLVACMLAHAGFNALSVSFSLYNEYFQNF
jgi:membrane protease YdiL (CAAX protease family)